MRAKKKTKNRKKTEKDEKGKAKPSRTDNEVKDGQTKDQLGKHRVRRGSPPAQAPEEQVALRARGMRLHPRRRGNLTAGGCEEEMVSS